MKASERPGGTRNQTGLNSREVIGCVGVVDFVGAARGDIDQLDRGDSLDIRYLLHSGRFENTGMHRGIVENRFVKRVTGGDAGFIGYPFFEVCDRPPIVDLGGLGLDFAGNLWFYNSTDAPSGIGSIL